VKKPTVNRVRVEVDLDLHDMPAMPLRFQGKEFFPVQATFVLDVDQGCLFFLRADVRGMAPRAEGRPGRSSRRETYSNYDAMPEPLRKVYDHVEARMAEMLT